MTLLNPILEFRIFDICITIIPKEENARPHLYVVLTWGILAPILI